jgi:hypothetical protein
MLNCPRNCRNGYIIFFNHQTRGFCTQCHAVFEYKLEQVGQLPAKLEGQMASQSAAGVE